MHYLIRITEPETDVQEPVRYVSTLNAREIRWTSSIDDACRYGAEALLETVSQFTAYLPENRVVIEQYEDETLYDEFSLLTFLIYAATNLLSSGKISYGELYALKRYQDEGF